MQTKKKKKLPNVRTGTSVFNRYFKNNSWKFVRDYTILYFVIFVSRTRITFWVLSATRMVFIFLRPQFENFGTCYTNIIYGLGDKKD